MSWGNELPVLFSSRSAESQIDRLLDDAIHSANGWLQSWSPACNVFENKEGSTVQMALPGLDANQINVQTFNSYRGHQTELARAGAYFSWYGIEAPDKHLQHLPHEIPTFS